MIKKILVSLKLRYAFAIAILSLCFLLSVIDRRAMLCNASENYYASHCFRKIELPRALGYGIHGDEVLAVHLSKPFSDVLYHVQLFKFEPVEPLETGTISYVLKNIKEIQSEDSLTIYFSSDNCCFIQDPYLKSELYVYSLDNLDNIPETYSLLDPNTIFFSQELWLRESGQNKVEVLRPSDQSVVSVMDEIDLSDVFLYDFQDIEVMHQQYGDMLNCMNHLGVETYYYKLHYGFFWYAEKISREESLLKIVALPACAPLYSQSVSGSIDSIRVTRNKNFLLWRETPNTLTLLNLDNLATRNFRFDELIEYYVINSNGYMVVQSDFHLYYEQVADGLP
ncbi:MAG: hypothetical protein OT477_02570 [Chloroflexi bacterium]|nr:hypothetical protein [Chloroflexota bacterium]